MPDRAIPSREKVEKDGLVHPKGLDWATLTKTIQMIEAWEMKEGTMATYLALDHYELFSSPPES